MSTSTDKVKGYLQRNWFKLGLALILFFIFLKKDLSFRINLNSPVRMEQAPLQPSTPARQQQKAPPPERYTDNTPQQTASTELPGTERFDFSSPPGSRRDVLAIDRLGQVDEGKVRAYIQRFGRVAVSEQKKFGIPASITIGNALLHSLAGTTEMAGAAANNHFGLLCSSNWQGAQHTYEGQCYRVYENAWTSFRDHSFYITTGPFAPLRQLSDTDYKGWADALEKTGFSREKNLGRQLVKVIEMYELQELGRR